MRKKLTGLIGVALLMFGGAASAGNIIMTGHDVLLHAGQRGFDLDALNYIRDGQTTYNIAVIGTAGTGGARFTGSFTNLPSLAHGASIPLVGSTLTTLDSAVFWDAQTVTAADFATVDAIVILSHTTCGGCSITNAGADALEALSGDIASAFNAGMDIWANSGARDATYYNFLPASVATTGPPISGSSGFTCTADGLALFGAGGCAAFNSKINGFATHNRFTGFDPDFTIFEQRLRTVPETITIGLRGGTIGTDDISTDDISTDGVAVPEPGTLALFGLGLVGLAALRRRRKV